MFWHGNDIVLVSNIVHLYLLIYIQVPPSRSEPAFRVGILILELVVMVTSLFPGESFNDQSDGQA